MSHSSSKSSFKVVLLGEAGVGKTSLFIRIKDDAFYDFQRSTVGLDTCTRAIPINGEKLSLTVWDTAGVERFRTLSQNYYRNAHVCLLLYSVREANTLRYLPKWIDEVQRDAPSAMKILVGNKLDLGSKVGECSEIDFASVYDCDFTCKVSAKSGEGVDELLVKVATKLHAEWQRKNNNQIPFTQSTEEYIKLNEVQENNGSRCLCSLIAS